MRITKYSVLLDENMFPGLFKENAVNYDEREFKDPENIVKMMNDVFWMEKRTEEFLYELCFTTRMQLIGVFEVSHGGVNYTVSNPREIFQRALLCGAARIVLVHNHPSGGTEPSTEDRNMTKHMIEAGELIGIPVVDSIIIGKSGRYLSFKEKALL